MEPFESKKVTSIRRPFSFTTLCGRCLHSLNGHAVSHSFNCQVYQTLPKNQKPNESHFDRHCPTSRASSILNLDSRTVNSLPFHRRRCKLNIWTHVYGNIVAHVGPSLISAKVRQDASKNQQDDYIILVKSWQLVKWVNNE